MIAGIVAIRIGNNCEPRLNWVLTYQSFNPVQYRIAQYKDKTMSSISRLILPTIAMAVVIVASNILVSYPINDWITWGAITFPFAFLVTDLTNRFYGASAARKVVVVGFAVGVAASLVLAEPRIALASGTAFFVAQMLDVSIFDKLRESKWWIAPATSSALSSIVDTFLFFSLAFVATGLPWMQWATGDLAVKWFVALLALIPYRLFVSSRPPASIS